MTAIASPTSSFRLLPVRANAMCQRCRSTNVAYYRSPGTNVWTLHQLVENPRPGVSGMYLDLDRSHRCPKKATRIKTEASKISLPPFCHIVRDPWPVTGIQVDRIREAGDVLKIIRPLAEREEVEVFWVLHLDSQSQCRGVEAVTRGLLNSSLVHPREVFRLAIGWGDAGIIVAHNHPSGDPTPSAEDRAATKQIVAAGQLLDVPVYDHVIVAGDRFVSFAEAGLL